MGKGLNFKKEIQRLDSRIRSTEDALPKTGWITRPDGTRYYQIPLDWVEHRETILELKRQAKERGISEEQVIMEALSLQVENNKQIPKS